MRPWPGDGSLARSSRAAAGRPRRAGAAQPGDSYLRLAHLSPDTPKVDVYVASVSDPSQSFVVPGVGYGAVSAYQPLPSGSYVISMRGAGAPADSPAVISTSVDARPGGAYTVAGLGPSAALGLSVLTDKLEHPGGRQGQRPGDQRVGQRAERRRRPGQRAGLGRPGQVRHRHAVRRRAAGHLESEGVRAGRRPELTTPCELDANSVYTVLLVDRGGSLTTELLTDSAGSKVLPNGGVNAGYGGSVGRFDADPALLLAGGLVAVVAAAAGLAGLAALDRAEPARDR